jgi:Zn-finger nucleic acid-binding protein
MKCPIDGSDLLVADRSGVEIDYCPTCRGVWLDRGELDKIIERSILQEGSSSNLSRVRSFHDDDDHDDSHDSDSRRQKRRRESPLSNFFDF